MVNFDISTVAPALVGGLLIGVASSLHLLLKGRITGMSGILNGIITFDESMSWKSSILSGLLFTSCVAYYIYGFDQVAPDMYFFDSPDTFSKGLRTGTLVIAGILVGLGTKLGNGCTSGHGVCGLPRFSLRSLVAVLTFMATGVIMANLSYYVIGQPQQAPQLLKSQHQQDDIIYVHLAFAISILILFYNFIKNSFLDTLISFVVGAIFSLGLLVSGMSRRSKVIGFLTFNKDWDVSLMFVMGGAVMLNLITFHYIIKIRQKPVYADKLSIPTNSNIDWKLIVGAALFGLGWGLGGICPGPGLIVSPVYASSTLQFVICMAFGQYLAMFIETLSIKRKAD